MTGAELKQICDAFLDAFGTRSELAQLVAFSLDKNLEEIAGPVDLGATVFELVRWAKGRGELHTLIDAARTSRPRNRALAELAALADGETGALPMPEVWIAALPSMRGRTIGRDEEKRILSRCWMDRRTHVTAVVGWGGSGKSHLVRSWLADLGPGLGGAERVFGWSFYAQGTDPRAVVSSDEFFARASEFFGGRPASADDDALVRAHDLARRIQARRTLLVLDGIEPCQDSTRGEIRDRALKYLLNDLAAAMNGLCVITTRPPFDELDALQGSSFERIDLRRLDLAAGADLLRDRGVRGTDADLGEAVEKFGGHALSLAVLGRYIRDVWQGDLRRARVELSELAVEDGKRLERLLASYDRSFGDARGEVLRAVGLFDRPAPLEDLRLVRDGRVVPGANDEMAWNRAISDLVQADLLSHDEALGTIDAHPLIRSHFASAFEAEDETAFRAAHGLLFEYLCASVPDPSTPAELGRLYRAVAHGCRAQRWDAAFGVLHDRIRQGEEHVSLKKFGAVSADLAAVACFFSLAWEPIPALSTWQKYWLQNSAGVLLRAEGSLADARRLLKAAVRTAHAEGRLDLAAGSARNLASTESAMGELTSALATAEQAIEFADASRDVRARIVSRDFRAHLLNRRGLLRESRAMFEEVERLRVAEDPAGKLRHYPEASFAALLVELGEPEVALRRARRALGMTDDTDSERSSPLNIGLTERSVARALAAVGDVEEAARLFDTSIEHLRRASRRDHIAPGLVDRARFLLHRDPERAARDIAEALEIAVPRGFRLVEADAHLTRARLEVSLGQVATAEASLVRARSLLAATGFELRVPILMIAEALVHAAAGRRSAADQALADAKRRAEAMGQLGLRPELERAAITITIASGVAEAR